MVFKESKENLEIINHAKTLSYDIRKKILMNYDEKEFYKLLKNLLEKMDPKAIVEITHGVDEYGKDLVMVFKNQFGIWVIGIVVKVGKITGKTEGKIDAIKSQIEQAYAHEAEIPGFIKPLKITNVWVVLSGTMSNNAKKRIVNEVDGNIVIHNSNWLIENFTNYYPQIFFDKDLIDYILKEINLLEVESMFSKRGKLLSECFIEPWVSTIAIPKEINEKTLKKISKIKRIPFSSLKSTLKSNRNILLVGEPGSGKSSALAKLKIDYLKKIHYKDIEASNIKIETPLLLKVSEFEKVNDVESLTKMKIPLELRNRAKINLLMIDGLDESEPVNRKNILEKAKSFAKGLNCALIISSRKIDIVEESLLDFQKYELLSFRLNQAFMFFKKIVKDVKVLQELKKGLQKIHFKIPLNPLTLLFLVELVEINKEVPASITELYDRFLDIALGRFDFEKGIKVLFDYYRKKIF